MDESAFQDVQSILINYLSKAQPKERSISTSCSLILSFYDQMNIEIPGLPRGSEEEKIVFLMKILTSNIKRFKRKFNKEIKLRVPKRYKDFLIPNEMQFPQVITPTRQFNSIHEGFLMNEINNILQKISELYRKKISLAHKSQYFLDLPIYLVVEKSTGLMVVKITAWKRQAMKLDIIMNRTSSFLSYIILSHFSLLEGISKKAGNNRNPFLYKAWMNFIGWINKELFKPENSLPLFGKVTTEELYGPLDASKFGDNQLAFLNYFTSKHGYKMLPIISIGFLGSWLKKFDPVLWNDNFNNDNSFVQFIIGRLMAHKNEFKGLKRDVSNLEDIRKKQKRDFSFLT
jgi:hypothetical protein